jgi:hypothetical protein
MMIAEAPLSSSSLAISMLWDRGEEEGTRGFLISRPRYLVVRSMALTSGKIHSSRWDIEGAEFGS